MLNVTIFVTLAYKDERVDNLVLRHSAFPDIACECQNSNLLSNFS